MKPKSKNRQRPAMTFGKILREIRNLHAEKNHAYGNAFHKTCSELMPEQAKGYQVGMLRAKVDRITALASSRDCRSSESVEDSLLDLASYSIMTLEEIRKQKYEFLDSLYYEI